MVKFSTTKTRLVFVAFFLLLMVPAILLSVQAYQQLRWQNLHQIRQIVSEFTQRVDSELIQALEQEEARSDTDYTFFVLAGSPEARFVQRSELSKFPVNSDVRGLLGYFQIDEQGNFSTPLLPSAYVQSEVVPSLYGISREENQQRVQLEQQIKQILSNNQLVTRVARSEDPAPSEKQLSETQDDNQNSGLAEAEEVRAVASQFQTDSQRFTRKKTPQKSSVQSEVAEQKQSQWKSSVNQSSAERQKAQKAKQLSQTQQLTEQRGYQSFYQEVEKQRQQTKPAATKLKSTNPQRQLKKEQLTSRKVRTEKNYSPQQNLLDQQSTSQLIEQKDIKLKLFESEIEPFRFNQLESGHFVLYRQVWRNNKRLVQGAIISAEEFLSNSFGQAFQQSTLFNNLELSVSFAGEKLTSWQPTHREYLASSAAELQGQPLSQINLSEPFSQLSLNFKVVDMPAAAGADFVILVAGCLLLGLTIGTYLLYRLVLKQSYLVQQQQDFVSSVSHELKTPLTSIRMYGEILKQGWVSNEKRMEYYDYIYSESERLSRLIANVLQISGVNHNALEVKLESVSVTELVDLLQSKIDSQIAQSGFQLKLEVDPEAEELSVVVDRDAFIQVMINLVDNAIKYAANPERPQIDVRISQIENQQLRFSLRDYGPGISKAHQKRIFDLFYRSGDELTREVKGTGIGLALVKELVKAMSAKISVKNRAPGADFRIDFPIN